VERNFLKSLSSVGGGAIAVSLGRFLCVIIATKYIPPEKLGLYFLLMAMIQIFSTVASFGTNTTIVKFLAEENDVEEKEKIIFSAVNMQLCALVATAGMAVICNSFLSYLNIRPSYLMLFISLSLFTYLNAVLQGLSYFKIISVVNALSGALKVVFVAIFVAYFQFGLEGLVVSLILSNIIPIGLQLYILYKNSSPSKYIIFDKAILKKMLTFSYPLYLNNLFSIAFNKGYTLIIALLLSPTAVAYYSIAERIPDLLNQARQVYATVFFPEIVTLLNKDPEKAKHLLKLTIELSFVLLTAVSFIFFIGGEGIIGLVFSEDYKKIAYAVALLLLAKPFLFSGSFIGQTLVALGQNKAPFRINIGISVLIIGLCFYYLPRYGYMAAIYVTLFTSFIGYAANSAYLRYCKIYIKSGKLISAMTLSCLLVAAAFIADEKVLTFISSAIFCCFWMLCIVNIFKSIYTATKKRNRIHALAK